MMARLAIGKATRTASRAASGILPLRLEGVRFEGGGARLLDQIDLEIEPGRTTVILGPNGAGKSLLLRICHGLLKPHAGSIRWAVPDGATVRRRQAMVFQKPTLLRRTVAANVAHALAAQGVPRRERGERVHHVLVEAGLQHLAGRPARVLSGGEQQRLALARALAVNPEVIFLDEPTASLDPAATGRIEALIARIRSEGTTIVMTTQDLGQARRVADDVVFLHHGRIVERQPAAAFFAGPVAAESRAFIEGRLLW